MQIFGKTYAPNEIEGIKRALKLPNPRFSSILQSQAENPVVYEVEQGEFAITSSERGWLGTTNVYDCIVLAIKNPSSQKVALVHYDYASEITSLAKVFERLGTVNKSQNYEVILAGGRANKFVNNRFSGGNKAEDNLSRIIHFLKDKSVNIVGKSLFEETSAANIVLDVNNFGFYLTSPTIRNEDKDFATGKFLNGAPKNLECVLDLTKSPARVPVRFNTEQIQAFGKKYSKSTEREIKEAFKSVYSTTPTLAQEYANGVIATKQGMQTVLGNREIMLQNLGARKSADIVMSVPVHLGKNGAKFESALRDIVQKSRGNPSQIKEGLKGLVSGDTYTDFSKINAIQRTY